MSISPRRKKYRSGRRLILEQLEARRVFAADLSLPDWAVADGLLDLSQFASDSDENLASVEAALAEHQNEHHEHAKGSENELLNDMGELPYGPILTIDVGTANDASNLPSSGSFMSSFAATSSSGLMVPALNSLPNAAASLYLDFDGHFESVWGQYTNVTSPPLDLDGDASSFSSEELTYIEDVWEIVAEDFSPFNINVTTVEPPTLATGVASSAANGNALRIAIGGGVEILGLESGIIGYAYYNSFTSSISNTAYVMPVRSGGTMATAVSVGSVSSHEAGHSFGLRHQNVGYNMTTRWQSIMYSVSFGYEDAYWAVGSNDLGAHQNDMLELANSTNGFGYRADDHGNTVASASSLVATGSAFAGSGVIGDNGDVDVWSLPATGLQSLEVSVEGVALGQNLNVAIDLIDASGNVLLTADPAESNDAELVFEPTGSEFVRVRSTGEYGRVGQYTITVGASTPGISVIADPTLLTSESGATDTFDVVLTSKPTSDVMVTLNSSSAQEGSLSASQLVFTPGNWYLPQSVMVQGVDDFQTDDAQAYLVNLAVISNDPNYAALAIEDLQAINADDEAPGWAVGLQGLTDGSSIYTNRMVLDSDGALLVTGSFAGTVDFDPGAGITTATANYLNNAYLAKYSAAGELIWVQTFGSPSSGLTTTNALTVGSDGAIYLSGSTSSSSLTLGSITLTSFGSSDAFLAKLNNQGEFIWAKNWGSTGSDAVYDMAIDASGNLVVVGNFFETVDFNPGVGTVTRTSAGGADGFVAKFDTSGNFQSVSTFGGINNDFPRELALDSVGNAYVSGYFVGTTTLGGQTLTSLGTADGFLVKISSSGNVVWVRQALSEAGSGLNARMARAADGTIHWASAFVGDVSFGLDTPTITNLGGNGIYLASFNENGDFLNVGQLDSGENLVLGDIAVDINGGLAVYGRMAAPADLAPSATVFEVSPVATNAEFVVQLDSNAQMITTHVMPTPNRNTVSRDVAFDSQGNLVISGQFYESVLTPTGRILENAQGNSATYLMKLNLAPGLSISSGDGVQVSEDGAEASISIALATPPAATVVVTLTSTDLSEGTVSPSTLTFTPFNWRTPQTVTVKGIDDALIDGAQAFEINISLTSNDLNYHALPIAAIHALNVDNDQPLVLFSDSFDVSEWNGVWVEDSQNDWFRSTQRSTDGNFSAEVDGLANDATLTTANVIDLTGLASAELTFDWLIESQFDAGEYLALDISTNAGASWTRDVRRLSGNVNAENVWHSEVVNLAPFMTANTKIRFRSKVSGSDEDANVDNVRMTGIVAGPNTPPVANAGSGYGMNEGSSVLLSGIGSSDPDGSIVGYAWDLDNDGQYDDANGVTASFSTVASGVHTIGLQVTDDRGATATTSTSVTVNNVAPTADAGVDQNVTLGTPVSLTAAASSDPGLDIVDYLWDLDNDGLFDDANVVSPVFTPASTGNYIIRVQVTDADGALSVDQMQLVVADVPAETTLFEDSFEASEWNGLWVEDSQNDWFRSTQRATHGSRSAEVDGLATNATLTMANGVNLTGYAIATLTFDWLIESGFDRGEFLALDISTNGGATWIQDVRRLNGDTSAEAIWLSETVDLSSYMSSNLKIRFRSSVSSSTEDANVDNVKIASSSGSAQLAAMTAASVDQFFDELRKRSFRR